MLESHQLLSPFQFSWLKRAATTLAILLLLGASQVFAAEVFTQEAEILPGDIALIDGITFWPHETVTLQVTQLDGPLLSGDGSLPWVVSASELGSFSTSWAVEWEYAGDILLVTATGDESGESATTTFVAPSSSLNQLQNGTTSSPPEWANGNINSSNSCYTEGSSVSYRYFLSEEDAGTPHFFTIQMEWSKGGIHALDYLTDYDATEDSAIDLTGGACGTISTTPPDGCSEPTETFPLPDFLNTANYTGTIPTDFFTTVNPGFVLDGPRNLMAYNCSIDSVGPYLFGGSASDRTLEFIVYFTVDTTGSVGFFWGGHLAEGSSDAWGLGDGSSSVSGAPYHMRAKSLDGGGGAGSDRSIQNGVICLPPNVGIICSADSVCNVGGQIYVCHDTASSANSWSWSIANGTIIGPNDLDSVVFTVDNCLSLGSYVELTVESCDSTSGCPGDFCCAMASAQVPVKACNNPPVATCPGNQTFYVCDLSPITLPGFSCDDPDDNLETCVATGGAYSAGNVTFTPVAGVNTITLTATDSCGLTDDCQTNVTIVLNSPPVATCPGNQTMFVCDLSPITLSGFSCSDADANLKSCVATGGSYSAGDVTFTPVAGVNNIVLTATDSCDAVDVCTTAVTITLNNPPVATCPGNQTMFVCDLSPIVLPGFSCDDTDGNLKSCVATGGSYSAGEVTFTPVPGVNTITLTATDSCDATDDCQTDVTIVLNNPPVATCPGNQTLFVCDLSPITLPGFSCDDPDGNLKSCIATGGSYSAGEVTFTPVPGINTITLTATDSCDVTDDCQTDVTIVLNSPPAANCPGDTSVTFTCEATEICYGSGFTSTDPDNNIKSEAVSHGVLNSGAVCFTPDTAGIYAIVYTVTDSCDAEDACTSHVTVSYANAPPVATCPGNQTMFVCDLLPITLSGFGCTDPDGNLETCVATGGTYSAGEVTFTPVAGVNTITLTATDSCGLTDDCQTDITIVLNSPPVATCPGNQTMFVCDLSPITLPGFSCDDPDGNLKSCVATGGSYSAGEVTFTPVPGINTITLTATDSCDATDDCQTDITIVLNSAPIATCPGNQTMFVCDLSPITLPGFGCDDTDGNLKSCVATGGAYSAGEVTFTPVPGINTITLTATDSCDLTDDCQTDVTIVLNSPPVANCPNDTTITFNCIPEEICYGSGFTSTDPDNNIESETVSLGTLNAGAVCFTPDTAGVYTIIYTVIDSCDAQDDCTTLVTVTYINQPPVANCPNDTTITFNCVPEEICYGSGFTSTDPDNNIESETVSHGVLDNGAVCFTPDTAGVYTIIYTVTDSCDAQDDCTTLITVVYTNESPICPSIDEYYFVCDDTTFNIPFTAYDPDGNLDSCAMTSGPGSYTGGVWTFTTNGSGVYGATFECVDSCGITCEGEAVVTVTLNSPPVASCPDPYEVFMCELDSLMVFGFSCSDPDNNLKSCETVPGPLINDSVTIMPVEGVNTIILTATDSCDVVDVCTTFVTVTLNRPPVASCPDPFEVFVCELVSLPVSGFSCSDPDNNLKSCETNSGPLVGGSVTIIPVEGVNAIILTATDSCGLIDVCTTTVVVNLNDPPIATCPGPVDTFMCDPGPLTINGFSCTDPNGNLKSCETTPGPLTGGSVTFTPVEGVNHIILTATDSCDAVDVCTTLVTVTLNRPPVATCPGPVDTFMCDLGPLTISGFDCSDADANLKSCETNQGSLTGGSVTFTPVAGINAIILTATDSCDAVDACTTLVTVELNSPPVANCASYEHRFVSNLDPITVSGFYCTDPDNNLQSCQTVPGPLVGDAVTFTPIEGDNYIVLTAIDDCNEIDICSTLIEVSITDDSMICPIVVIEKTHGTIQGHYEDVSITFQVTPGDTLFHEIGGFDFLIAYDASALAPMGVEPGQLLEDCGWEYFTYRYGVYGNCGNACPSGLLRIIAIAETNNGPNHPLCYGPPDSDPHEIAVMTFFVTNDRTFECQYVPIYFFWADCSDNSVSTIDGDTLIIDTRIFDFEGNLIWDEDDDDQFPEDERIPFVGAPDYCLEGDKLYPIRCLDLYEGGIDIVCADSIDARGDINVNGVANEVADAVMLTNYFINGLTAFGNHVEASIAASDINADGIALSVADLVYLVRVIAGDAPPFAKPMPADNFEVTTRMDNDRLRVEYNSSSNAGAALLVFNVNGSIGEPQLGSGAASMDLDYRLENNELRVLVYNIGPNSISAGSADLLIIPVDGSLELAEIEVADYYGRIMNASAQSLPDRFELSQNYPNPFNPSTTIKFTLPVESDWTLKVYDILGQVVETWTGHGQPGEIQIDWNASKNVSGIYFYRLKAGNYTQSKKMMLLK